MMIRLSILFSAFVLSGCSHRRQLSAAPGGKSPVGFGGKDTVSVMREEPARKPAPRPRKASARSVGGSDSGSGGGMVREKPTAAPVETPPPSRQTEAWKKIAKSFEALDPAAGEETVDKPGAEAGTQAGSRVPLPSGETAPR